MSELQELIPMTLDEFETMIKDERLCYELIDGIVAMSPSPSFQHQVLGSRLVSIASNQLKSVCTAVYEFTLGYSVRIGEGLAFVKRDFEFTINSLFGVARIYASNGEFAFVFKAYCGDLTNAMG